MSTRGLLKMMNKAGLFYLIRYFIQEQALFLRPIRTWLGTHFGTLLNLLPCTECGDKA